MGRALAALALVFAAACEGGPLASGVVAWAPEVEVALDDQGMSEPVTLPFAAGQRYVALRARPAAEVGVCYRFEPITLGDGGVLAPPSSGYDSGEPCATCTESLGLRRDGALALLPGAAALLPAGGALTVRVVARDCALGIRVSRARIAALPTSVRISSTSERLEDRASARLGVRILVLTGAELDDALLRAAFEGVRARYAEVGIEAVLEKVARLVHDGPVVVPLAGTPALRALVDSVISTLSEGADDRRFVPVALAGCLAVESQVQGSLHPFGVTTEIPGLPDEQRALIVLGLGRCEADAVVSAPWPAETGGAILAHELGHYLGLFHSDTKAGAAQTDGGGRLMATDVIAVPLAETHFSPLQGAVLRRHPLSLAPPR